MARGSKPKTVRNCVTVLIIIVAVFLSIRLLPAAHASDEVCLRIALPEATKKSFGPEIYRDVMADAGLCVDPIRMPNARAALALRDGSVDGAFAMLDEFAHEAGVPILRGNVLVGKPDGMLVVRDGTITDLSELSNEIIGIWLGASWSEKLLRDYTNIVRCPGGPDMMLEMLNIGRIDAMLINSFSLELIGGVPDGYVAIPIIKLPVYSWLRAEHADVMPMFDAGTDRFIKKVMEWRKRAAMADK